MSTGLVNAGLVEKVGYTAHLARRFVGSLRPGPPPARHEQWAVDHLLPGELAVWSSMTNPDRRHAVAVARVVAVELGSAATRDVVAAALLHDSGKVISGLGTFRRVAATLVWAVVDDATAPRWANTPSGPKRRLGQYRLHPELGAALLTAAGSEPLTVAWAREHHRDPGSWTVPGPLARVLKACDDD